MQESYRAHEKRFLSIRRSNFLLVLLTICYVSYLLIGGAVFMRVESPIETELKKSLLTLRNEFIRKHPCVTEAALEDLILSVVNAKDQGIVVIHNVSDTDSRWDFGESMFFATTLITTIGYGHMTPLSTFGKGFSILYSVVGIPLTLILFTAYAERLIAVAYMLLTFIAKRVNTYIGSLSIQLIHLLIVGTLIFIFFFLIPSAIFFHFEPKWTYFDCLYFCFISLTTIGLGDLVPGEAMGYDYHIVYKVAVTFYLIIGLTFMVMFLALVSDIPELNISLFFLNKGDEITDDPEQMRLPLHSDERIPRYLIFDHSNNIKTPMTINQFDSQKVEADIKR